jgi:hypothetical protein
VRWCADADISAVLFLRPTAEVPLSATWLKKDDAVSFETLILETDDGDRSTQSWEKLSAALPQILPFLTNAIKVPITRSYYQCDGMAPFDEHTPLLLHWLF